jgi:anaerobic dimethyl sulfoxide reductase subunit A
MGLTGCKKTTVEEIEQAKKEGEWLVATCASYVCGSGRCTNKVLVENNTIIRQKTDDAVTDSLINPQQRGCLRGRAQRKTVTGVDRLKYPMKRTHWESGGGNKELRGRDTWERISWEEALDIVASEILRIKEKYGSSSIASAKKYGGNEALAATWTFGYPRLLHAIGGVHRFWGPISIGAWGACITHLTGLHHMTVYLGAPNSINDRLDYCNSKLIVFWGCNPAWSVANSVYYIENARQAGAKIIVVDPMYSATAQAFADQWIAVRPSTDTALILGMAYHIIQNNLQDQEFLDACTIGFDAEHMPSDAAEDGNFKDYVLGTYDNQPKTPSWAENICGVPEETIRAFATEIATTKPAAILSAYSPSRTFNGERFCQAFMTLGWMTGNVGKPGACVGVSCNVNAFNQGQMLVTTGTDGLPTYDNPIFPYDYYAATSPPPDAEDWHSPNINEAWEAIVSNEYTAGTRGKQPIDIQLISHLGAGNALNQFPNLNKGIEAHRKVEFVVTSDLVPTPSCQFSDIVLPVTHCWERVGSFNGLGIPHRDRFVWGSQVVKPPFECKDDSWIERELALRLGLDPDEYLPFGEEQAVFNQVATSTVIKENGIDYEPLAAITAEDIAYYGVEGKPQEGRIPIRELQKIGNYQVQRSVDDNFSYIAFKDFVADPKVNPLNTKSGKFEIFCQSLCDTVNAYGWTKIAPIAKYEPLPRGFEEAQNSTYPLQLITPHYLRRAHSSLDSNPWLREAFTQEVFMNSIDAKARGIQDGDAIKVFNEYGTVLRNVKVTERIIPGVVAMGEGAWVDIDEETGYDIGGATNSLAGGWPNGQGTQAWNTNIVEVQKYDGLLVPDCLREPKTIS